MMGKVWRYAIYALVDHQSAQEIRGHQQELAQDTGNCLALAFPVHITLRGRFAAAPEFVSIFEDTTAALLETSFAFGWRGPIHVLPDMAWLDVPRSGKGIEYLRKLHNFFEELTADFLAWDETPQSFKAEGFRPHITLGWGITGGFQVNRENTLEGQASTRALALAHYPDSWPLNGNVDILCEIPLVGR
jgi:hypothetical protein